MTQASEYPDVDRDALRREALRVHQRYARELVEGLGFCPFAAAARTEDRVRTVVLFGVELDLPQTLREIQALASDENTDVGLLVFPELALGRLEFQHAASEVRRHYEQLGDGGSSGFAIADFHPDATPDLESAARLVAFIRRSPDPTLQLVRITALQAARRGEVHGTRFMDASVLMRSEPSELLEQAEPLHMRLARANLQTVLRLGVDQVAATFDDILRDRDLSYARLGVPPPQWGKMGKPPTK